MKFSLRRSHSMDSLFIMLLFGFFVLFLLLMLLFSTRAYQAAVEGNKENNELRTAMAYITTKVHQHHASDDVFIGEVDEIPALCLRDTIEGRDYLTYIFLDNGNLKELFTGDSTTPVKELGTPFCDMQNFEITDLGDHLYRFSLTDTSGHCGELILHPEIPKGGLS